MRALEGGSSTTKQILIDQDLRGWKEVEYEVCVGVLLTLCHRRDSSPSDEVSGPNLGRFGPHGRLDARAIFMGRSDSVGLLRHRRDSLEAWDHVQTRSRRGGGVTRHATAGRPRRAGQLHHGLQHGELRPARGPHGRLDCFTHVHAFGLLKKLPNGETTVFD